MGKVVKIDKSRKEFRCSKCGEVIPIGSAYYRGELNFAHDIIRCSKCRLKPWEVTTSDYKLSVGNIVYNWREDFGVSEDVIEQIADELESIRDDLQDRLDNMPEGLQEGDAGQILQDRIDCLEYAIDELNSIDIDDIKYEIVDVLVSEVDHVCVSTGPDDYDYDDIYAHNPEYQERLSEDFVENLSDAIESALSNIEV